MGITLIVEDNIHFQDFYALNLYTWVGTKTLLALNAKFGIELIQNNKVDLIITRVKVSTEQTLAAVQNHLKANNLNIPVIALGEKIKDPKVISIVSGVDIKAIVKSAATQLGVTAESMASLAVDKYFPIPIKYFSHLQRAVCDTYLNTETVLTQEGEAYQTLKHKEYIASGSLNYYVNKSDRLKFVSNYNQVLASKLEYLELNKDERVQATELTQDLIRLQLKKIGITDELVELSQKNLKEMVKNTKETNSLMKFIKRLLKNKAGYHFKHTQLLMFVGSHVMEHMDWGTQEQLEKFQFIAYFHDITLEDDIQSRIHSKEELKKANIPLEKKELVKNHAMLSATLVAQYPHAPMGVEQLIKQHHGSLNGIDFSDHYSQNVSPMSIVHIVAEDFIASLIDDPKGFSPQKQVSKMREKFTTQRYKKILDILETIATN